MKYKTSYLCQREGHNDPAMTEVITREPIGMVLVSQVLSMDGYSEYTIMASNTLYRIKSVCMPTNLPPPNKTYLFAPSEWILLYTKVNG